MPTYDIPDHLKAIRPDPITGQQRRFVCKCGMKSLDPVDGMMHSFAELENTREHTVHEERFSLGLWVYDRQSVGTKILTKMRRKGESVSEFAARITRQLNAATAMMEAAK